MRINYLLVVILFGILLQSCTKVEIIPPETEITNIYNVTDSSADFDITVISPSNAEWDDGYDICFDTVLILEHHISLYGAGPFAIDSFLSVTVPGLQSNTHYFVRLLYYGTFNIGGPNELQYFYVGEPKEFTTLP